jgi:hypothetical protein
VIVLTYFLLLVKYLTDNLIKTNELYSYLFLG